MNADATVPDGGRGEGNKPKFRFHRRRLLIGLLSVGVAAALVALRPPNTAIGEQRRITSRLSPVRKSAVADSQPDGCDQIGLEKSPDGADALFKKIYIQLEKGMTLRTHRTCQVIFLADVDPVWFAVEVQPEVT